MHFIIIKIGLFELFFSSSGNLIEYYAEQYYYSIERKNYWYFSLKTIF
jgi:hypothetical protein